MTAARRLIDIGEVSQMLGARMATLAAELLPHGKRINHEWVIDEKGGDKISVHIGPGKNIWKCWNGTDHGDALDLVAYCLFAGNKSKALHWSLRWLGIETGNPASIETVRRATPPKAETDAKTAEDMEAARAGAMRIWRHGDEQVRNTPVDLYLKGRHIDLAELGRQPGAIHYHPSLFNKESNRKWPAMVTAISGPGGFLAVHRTWLEVHADGRVTKAPLDKAKMVYGAFRGGLISIWRGASDKPLKQARPGETLDMTEGIENALSVAIAMPEARVCAAISLSNWPNVVLPDAIHTVRLWRDNDSGAPQLAAFEKVIAAYVSQKKTVLVCEMPRGVKDVNDLLRHADG